jgi:hypothetical protein
MPWD